jgi:hypothetical protein
VTDSPAPVTIDSDELLSLEHLPNKADETWAIVNRQSGGLSCDGFATRETFVVARRADATLWAATFDVGIAVEDSQPVELTPVRMVACLAVAYVEASDSGESMPVLAVKPPQLIRDHVVKCASPTNALTRLTDTIDKLGGAPSRDGMADILTAANAIRYLTLRCIELQGPAASVELQS